MARSASTSSLPSMIHQVDQFDGFPTAPGEWRACSGESRITGAKKRDQKAWRSSVAWVCRISPKGGVVTLTPRWHRFSAGGNLVLCCMVVYCVCCCGGHICWLSILLCGACCFDAQVVVCCTLFLSKKHVQCTPKRIGVCFLGVNM